MNLAPLSGIRVLDLGRTFAAPWCTQMLADLGAEVIKIERPGRGDEMRHYGPPFLQSDGETDRTQSAYFLAANRNKKSVQVDLTVPEGQQLIRDLAQHCQIFMENFKVGDLARYGLDYASIAQINPDIIYCSITGFGQTGPYAKRPATDGVFQAMSGLMSVTGEPGMMPQKVGLIVSDQFAGLYAAIAIQAALRQREVLGGTGQHIDISLLDVSVAAMSHRATEYLMTGKVPGPLGTRTAGSAPAQLYRCKDGLINLQAGAEPKFIALCHIIGRLDLLADPRFATRATRFEHADILELELERSFAEWTMSDLFEKLVAANIIASPVYSVDQMFADPQIKSRQLERHVLDDAGRDVPLLANPIRFSNTDFSIPTAPPAIGANTDEVLETLLGKNAAAIQRLRESRAI
jgi:crotonobetainyl-CoA:carnitine CoA-transferase CaiB-like acyl-CoA transferase